MVLIIKNKQTYTRSSERYQTMCDGHGLIDTHITVVNERLELKMAFSWLPCPQVYKVWITFYQPDELACDVELFWEENVPGAVGEAVWTWWLLGSSWFRKPLLRGACGRSPASEASWSCKSQRFHGCPVMCCLGSSSQSLSWCLSLHPSPDSVVCLCCFVSSLLLLLLLCCAQSCPALCDPMNCTRQVRLSMGFPRQEYWSGLPFPSPEDLPDAGITPSSPALAGGFFTIWATWEAFNPS